MDVKDDFEEVDILKTKVSQLMTANAKYTSIERLHKIFILSTCYELMPDSSKVVVLDSSLKVSNAFHALASVDSRGAIIWDSSQNAYTGMFTISDFIHAVLKFNHHFDNNIEIIESQKISTWRELCYDKTSSSRLLMVDVNCNILSAFTKMNQARIHRLPVYDPENNDILFVATNKRILRFFYDKLSHEEGIPSFFQNTIEELNIGTYEKIIVINYKYTLSQVLNLFIKHKVSAFPVVDDDKRLVDIYSKSDVINLAAEKSYVNLEAPVSTALIHRDLGFEGVLKCYKHEKFGDIVYKMVSEKVHRLVVVDEENTVTGIVSLSDVLKYLFNSEKTLN